jgi:predicted nuclease with TOPRIM domain
MSDLNRAISTPYGLRDQARRDYAEGRRRRQRGDADSEYNLDDSSLLPTDSASNFEPHQSGAMSASASALIATANCKQEINAVFDDFVDVLNEGLRPVNMRLGFSDVRYVTDAIFLSVDGLQHRTQLKLLAQDAEIMSLRRQLREAQLLKSQVAQLNTQLESSQAQAAQVNAQLNTELGELGGTNKALGEYVSELQGEVEHLKALQDALKAQLATSETARRGADAARISAAEAEIELRNKIQDQTIVIERLMDKIKAYDNDRFNVQERIEMATENPDWVTVENDASSFITSVHFPWA